MLLRMRGGGKARRLRAWRESCRSVFPPPRIRMPFGLRLCRAASAAARRQGKGPLESSSLGAFHEKVVVCQARRGGLRRRAPPEALLIFPCAIIAFVTIAPARAEDRAMQGCNPSADPGTKTEAGCPARHLASLGPREPRDWYQSDKSRGPGGWPPDAPFLYHLRIVHVRQISPRMLDTANRSARASSPPPIDLASIRTLGEPLWARCLLGSVPIGCCHLRGGFRYCCLGSKRSHRDSVDDGSLPLFVNRLSSQPPEAFLTMLLFPALAYAIAAAGEACSTIRVLRSGS